MTDTNNQSAASKTPSHIAYQVDDREGKTGAFTRVGAAWPHKDGKGFNVKTPGGLIILRVTSKKAD